LALHPLLVHCLTTVVVRAEALLDPLAEVPTFFTGFLTAAADRPDFAS
jgi:hypothetical protein